MAIEVSAVVAILNFSKHLKMAFWAIAYCPIELRIALRSTVSEIMAIEVSTLVAILDFSKHIKMAFLAIAYCPLGRNRALFHSRIDGFRDNGNRSFGQVATVQNLKIRNFRAKHTICILFPLVLAIHLDHNLRNAGQVLEIFS